MNVLDNVALGIPTTGYLTRCASRDSMQHIGLPGYTFLLATPSTNYILPLLSDRTGRSSTSHTVGLVVLARQSSPVGTSNIISEDYYTWLLTTRRDIVPDSIASCPKTFARLCTVQYHSEYRYDTILRALVI